MVPLPVRQQGLGNQARPEDRVESQPGVGILVLGVRNISIVLDKVHPVLGPIKWAPRVWCAPRHYSALASASQ